MHVLCGEGGVVHEEKVELADVVDEESLVAGGHHVAGLLVGTVADLLYACQSLRLVSSFHSAPHPSSRASLGSNGAEWS